MRESVGFLKFPVDSVESVMLYVDHNGVLASPKTDVKVTADVWTITNQGTELSKKRKSYTAHAPNCTVDFKNRVIVTPSGKNLEANNIKEVVDAIEEYIGNL